MLICLRFCGMSICFWQFEHRHSSPYYPRSNGLAERYVQEAAKNVLKRCSMDDTEVQMALLNAKEYSQGTSWIDQ
jgi:hypothetical protein